jgi:hypothetical protein
MLAACAVRQHRAQRKPQEIQTMNAPAALRMKRKSRDREYVRQHHAWRPAMLSV